ncbi:hypothetical protein [Acinetobacter larvae]|uniref:DUF3592 domain-containing protein n=1 Tax=Acinetobacter larvae TaxID=1789224 RepID=A0A1B2M2K8_9GAMM|nr:hypothetical protein [Acinetobacter larvae]AOA59436.1 hypothetical protein BFG52_14490 [Acinetobacter larvae]
MNLLKVLYAVLILALCAYFWWRFFLRDMVYRIKNHRNGRSTTAEIIARQDMLLKIQHRPMYLITLRFKDCDDHIQQVQLKVLLRKQQLVDFNLGQSVPIRYHPEHLENIQIPGVIVL